MESEINIYNSICDKIANIMQLDINNLKNSRKLENVNLRHLIQFCLFDNMKIYNLSKPRIFSIIGAWSNRDRTTILHAVNKISYQIHKYGNINDLYQIIDSITVNKLNNYLIFVKNSKLEIIKKPL